MSKKKELSPEQLEECRALKAIWDRKKGELELTQQKAADALEISQGAVSHYLGGRNALNPEVAIAFSRMLEVPISDFSRRLSREINQLAEGVVMDSSEIRRMTQAPVISWVTATKFCESEDPYPPGDAEEWLPATGHSEAAYYLKVSGDSMWPAYQDGEYILVDPLVEARHNSDVIARTDDGRYAFKRLQITPEGTYLLALNPDHPERKIKIPPETHICGVVIGSWIKRR